ncbi:hypothetical protein OK348_07050 [Flavobacterium sp. MXW15]|uniref:Uncharacterized protein n=1 Tax=Xanthomonas chitinilytica TaxID=2989819 RepID=A0ABT3JTP0_9XANT|nr:hypothetical protein [Xanthomonas sp. H13-6]MCW4454551.1 hypothetical protein [Flavobacterium sp. MXW15]MCW4471790.1 hypothetical protein [Xanthomonas sp. H13-6]
MQWKEKRPSRQDAAAVRGREGTMRADAERQASHREDFCVVACGGFMVSDEIEAGNEKPRTGAGAGF